jgi:tetratricopeptide (TPR) repeat protein
MLMKTLCRIFCIALGIWLLSACQSTGPVKTGKKSADVASLSESQSVLYQQALTHLEQQQPRQAENLLQGLLRERRDIAELWLNLALSQYQQKKWQQVEGAVAELLNTFPNVPQAHNLAGLLAVEKGEFAKAEQHYAQALKLDSEYANALYNMALLQDVYLQNINAAVNYYSQYLRLIEDEETKAWVENLSQTAAP